MLTSRHSTLLIAGDAASTAMGAGAPLLLAEEPAITPDGWDNLTATYALFRAALTPEQLAALWPIGSRLGSRNWWVTGAKPICLAQGVWSAAVEYKGYASAKPCKINWGCAVDQQSAQNVSAPAYPGPGGSVTYAKVSVSESMPTFSFSYLCANVEAGWPSTPTLPSLLVGRERPASPAWTDPSTGATITPPPLPDTIWDALTEFVYHWPYGWVLMDLQADILPGTRAGLVTESYKYVRPKTP